MRIIDEDNLGITIKAARKDKHLTQEELAEKVGVGLRHIMALENEGRHPSYELLYKLIRVLNIHANAIFYPETSAPDSEIDEITRMLYKCDERTLKVIRAVVEAATDS